MTSTLKRRDDERGATVTVMPGRLMRQISIFLTIGLVHAAAAHAATIAAASCATAPVQTAINAAVDGDTVVVPSGSCTWTSGVVISGKGIKLKGGGSGRIIARSTTSVAVGTGAKTFSTASALSLVTGQTLRVSKTGTRSIFMEGTVTSYSGTTLTMSITNTGGSGTAELWIISTNPITTVINNSSSTMIDVTEDTTHHVEISGIKIAAGSGSGRGITINRVTNGQAVLVHDCWLELGSSNGDLIWTDANRGVIWNCSFDASPFSMAPLAVHLQDAPTDSWTSPSTMGMADTTGTNNLYVEDSDFHAWLNATDFDDNARAVIRHSVFNNAAVGTHGADTSNYGQRHFEVYDTEFVFNGYSNGTTFPLNWWFFLRGGTGVITDNILPAITSGDYPNKTEINMTVMNLQRNAGPNPCWGANIPGIQYPAPRQVGMGRVTGAAGNDSITYKGDSEPLYIWNNSGGYAPGTDDFGGGACTNPDSTADYVIAGRDYFNNGTAKPGYTKYTYPHPLRPLGGSAPAAPTNLRIVN
jgi:hypothetical protein